MTTTEWAAYIKARRNAGEARLYEVLRDLADVESWTADDWHTTSFRVGRNYTPALLHALKFRLPSEVLTIAVPDAWTNAEFPRQCLAQAEWRDLFTRGGYTHDGQPADRPAQPLQLWRGACHQGRRGWAWTDDLAIAEDFAYRKIRGQSGGSPWTVTAPPEALLAYIHHESGRGESEYVVDTRGLKICLAQPDDVTQAVGAA